MVNVVIKKIPFNGDVLLGVKTQDGQVWLAVRKACTDIGLSDAQARAEVTKIQDSLLFANKCKKLSLKFETQIREMLFLQEKFVPMWLAQINLTPQMQQNKPDVVRKLLFYQLNAAEVLHKAFYGSDEQKQKLHEVLGLKGQIEVLQVQINNIEYMLEDQTEKFEAIIDNMTLSTRQQQKLYKAAKDRVNHLLGGAHTKEYKKNAKSYFINLWNGLKESYDCGSSYKDLNPRYFSVALDYISQWEYINN